MFRHVTEALCHCGQNLFSYIFFVDAGHPVVMLNVNGQNNPREQDKIIHSTESCIVPLSTDILPPNKPFLRRIPRTRRTRNIAPAIAAITTPYWVFLPEGGSKSVQEERILQIQFYCLEQKVQKTQGSTWLTFSLIQTIKLYTSNPTYRCLNQIAAHVNRKFVLHTKW